MDSACIRIAFAVSASKNSMPPDSAFPTETWLLGVVGMSPTVLTETLWALAHERPATVPSRVIVITTTRGRNEIERSLFKPLPRFNDSTPWQALREALALEGHDMRDKLRFGLTGDDIRIITVQDPSTGLSRELSDIRSPQENEAAADFILEQVRGIVQNPDVDLVASVAGGRKTMGALLYGCMTLAARETDRLTHVLVNEPFETLREFYFPGQPGGSVATLSGQSHDPALACVDLADISFVPIRNLFLRELNRPVGNFRALVEVCRSGVRRRSGEDLRIEISLRRTLLTVNGSTLDTSAREHAVLVTLARRAKDNTQPLTNYKEAAEAVQEMLDELRDSLSATESFACWAHELFGKDLDEELIRKVLSSLRGKLRDQGPPLSLLAQCLPERGRFSIEVPGPMIHLKP